MRRDLDLIRQMLLLIEEQLPNGSGLCVADFASLNDDTAVICFHLELLYESGMIEAIPISALGIHDYRVERLTFTGCDYLDAVRDDNIWHATTERLKTVGSSAGLEVVKSLANNLTRAVLGI